MTREEQIARNLDKPLLAAAILVIPVVMIEGSNLTDPWQTIAADLNWIIWTVFAAEIIIMMTITDRRVAWLRRHPLEIAIVLFTAPILPASLQAARAFRLLRLLRLVRTVRLMRRLLSAEGVRDAAILAGATILLGGAAYAAVERHQHLSSWDGVWWAIVTMTTVGYGDTYPHTTGGRLIAVAVMVVGIGFVAILTAAAAERFVRPSVETGRELAAVRAQLDEVLRRLDASGD